MAKQKTRLNTDLINSLMVRKSNQLIETGTDMKMLEQKIILTAMSQINVDDTDFKTCVFTVKELAEILGTKSKSIHEDVKIASEKLMKSYYHKPIEGKNNFEMISVVSRARYENGVLEIVLDEHLKEDLLELKKTGKFTTFRLNETMKLKTSKSISLYQLLVRDRNLPRKTTHWKQRHELQKVKDALLCGDKYNEFKHFKSKVLTPRVNEINIHTNLTVSFEKVKTGRSVTHLDFVMIEEVNEEALKQAIKDTTNTHNDREYKSDETLERDSELYDLEVKLTNATEDQKERFEEIFVSNKELYTNKGNLSFFTEEAVLKSARSNALIQWANEL